MALGVVKILVFKNLLLNSMVVYPIVILVDI